MSNRTPAYAVGIDWADLKHDVFERHPDGSLHHQQISSSPEAITDWLFALRSVSDRVAVAVEQRRGPLFHCLIQCLEWMDLCPINPQTLARYRQAFYTSRAKDDPIMATRRNMITQGTGLFKDYDLRVACQWAENFEPTAWAISQRWAYY